jgi:hypothetical protein
VRAMLLLRSPIKILLASQNLSFGNVPDANFVRGTRVPVACHHDLLLVVESKSKKT